MDFIAPAIVGVGLYLAWYAWKSHSTGTPPTPLADAKKALAASVNVVPSQPGQAGYGAAAPGTTVNQATGVAG